ncbi:MAG: hypothetical protein ACOCY1_04305 [Halovenus sp.]
MGDIEDPTPQTVECPTCGQQYKRPSRHWAAAGVDCEWPSIDETLRAHLDGIAVAGGSADGGEHTRLRTWTTSPERARWLVAALDWLAYSLDGRERADKHPQYVIRTMSHPALAEYRRWAGRGVPPERVAWSRPFGRVWYALAGGLAKLEARTPSLQIGARTSERRRTRLATLIESGGYDVRVGARALILSPSETRTLLADLGPPTPGTAYKWVLDPALQQDARERALTDDPLVTVGDDAPTIARTLVESVAERRALPDAETWDRYIASPTGVEIAEYFGGGDWGDALSALGADPIASSAPTPTPSSAPTPTYTKQDAIEAIRAAADAVGEPLSQTQYMDWYASHLDVPSRSTIVQRWGWSDTLREAGVEPTRHDPDRELWITAVSRIREELGGWPTSAQYREYKRPGDPSVAWVYNGDGGFGDWRTAIEIAKRDTQD